MRVGVCTFTLVSAIFSPFREMPRSARVGTLLLPHYAFTNISRGATCSESLPPLKLKVCTGLRVP